MKYFYLASPYGHPDADVRLDRYHRVAAHAGLMMAAGDVVFCPITHSHQIGVALNLPVDHEFWSRQDMPFLVHASELVVLTLPGWEDSVGIDAEISIAEGLGIPVLFEREGFMTLLRKPPA